MSNQCLSYYEPVEGYKSYTTNSPIRNDNSSLGGSSTGGPGCCCCCCCQQCCHHHRHSHSGGGESCMSAMRTHKSYLALILVPYLILIAVFHSQLQVYDGGGHHRVLRDDQEHFQGVLVAVEQEQQQPQQQKPLPQRQHATDHFQDLAALKHGTMKGRHTVVDHGAQLLRSKNSFDANFNAKFNAIKVHKEVIHSHNKTVIFSPSKYLQDDHGSGSFKERSFCNGSAEWNSAYPITKQCCASSVIKDIPHVHFQPIQQHWVYTAYLDTRLDQPPQVRVIMLIKKLKRPILACRFPKHDGANVTTAADFISVIPGYYEMCENHAKDYGGWILSCRVPSELRVAPCWVVISVQPPYIGGKADVKVPVFTIDAPKNPKPREGKDNTSKQEFGVCIPPIFGYIPSTTLVEFIEMTKLLGASHLVFYTHQVSREIHKVLSYYAAQTDLVTVITWDLPVSDKHIWYHGQLLAINDCLYRGMHRFQYLAFNDLDEFIVPHSGHARNWTEMIQVIKKKSTQEKSDPDKHCGYSFQSAFFDPLSSGSRVLYDLESDLRTKSHSSVRTKTMVHPERMFELGIHHMSRPILDKYTPYNVQPSEAYIHHYRKCVTDFDPKMNCQIYAKDESMSPYIPSLRHSVHQVLWTLKEIEKKHTWRGR